MDTEPSHPAAKAARRLIVPLLCLLAGGLLGYLLHHFIDMQDRAGAALFTEQRESGYRLISPLLDCDSSEKYSKNRELKPFQRDVERFIRDELDQNWAQDIAVYFRELNDGLWFDIGESERFTPASLLKVPLMIAYFKEAERDPGILARKLRFQGGEDQNSYQAIKPSQPMRAGENYRVDDLIFRMIVYSDNNALALLQDHVDISALSEVYDDMGVFNPYRGNVEDVLSVTEYAHFFRTLYNATYLNRDGSEKALEYLSRTEFRDGLVAGVPPAVVVAHKFGERTYEDTGEKQLHDCGIVYYPKHPYILCVMSRGRSFEFLDKAIAEISRIVYHHVDAQHSQSHLK